MECDNDFLNEHNIHVCHGMKDGAFILTMSAHCRRYMTEILLIRRKTLSNQSINRHTEMSRVLLYFRRISHVHFGI